MKNAFSLRLSVPMGIWLALGAVLWFIAYSAVEPFSQWFTYDLLRLERGSHLGEALAFFIYDVPKLLLLLSGMIFLITLAQTFLDVERVRAFMEKRGEGTGNLLAAIFGAMTPFCSCSSVPLFIGFVQAGIPLGITFSFLITSPIMNQVAFVMLLGLFGWQVAVLYLAAGILIGVRAGIVLGRLKLERYVEPFVYALKRNEGQSPDVAERPSWSERVERALAATREIVGRVWLFVVIGIGIGAFIHGFVPEGALTEALGTGAWWSVPIAVVVGIPLYSNAAGIIPVISSLLGKGVALGTALAFMMSVVALSLPELIILRKVLKPRLIAIFVGVVALAIISIGYLFNLLQIV
ncbi:MAG: permease [Aggregatilineales bacterium]